MAVLPPSCPKEETHYLLQLLEFKLSGRFAAEVDPSCPKKTHYLLQLLEFKKAAALRP